MAQTVSDHIIQRLYAWGVRTIYGYPGDGINGLIGAIDRCDGRIRFIQPRHEEAAAFMACGHAKFTGGIGVCMATSGPGAIHLLNGLYDAQMDHQPVVAIVGQSARTAIGSDYQQEVDLKTLFKDVAHHYVHECTHPAAARHQIDRALRIAFAERVVTCVIIPHDVQELDGVDSPPREHDTTLTGIGYHRGVVVPAAYDLNAAAEVLNSGTKVAMLVGAGALGATSEVLAVADALGAGIAKALLGKAVVPDHLPFVTGAIGLLGTEPSDRMIEHCDTLLMVGSSFPYVEFLPKEGQARGVQIDISSRMLSLRYPMEVSLHGDAAQTLRALLSQLEHKQDRRWRADIEGWVADWWKVMEKRAMESATPINPQRVFWELSPRLPDNAILTADSGSCASWWARDLKIRSGMMASLSGNLATMGPAMPYAAAAKFAHPDRPVVAAIGDGAMQMIGNSVLITVAAHYREWQDPRLVVVVLNNGDLNMVTWEQRVMVGDPKFEASQNLPAFPYARYAQLIGLDGIEVTSPEQIAPALDQAMQGDRPVVVECHVDPEVPPLPPHISFKQTKNFVSSILHGDPHRWRMIQQSAKQVWAAMAAK
ncbi:MAG TPA: thiamine pyrophosphate-requiring protein [Kofleriaceae bacterium]|jgi:pyruvate dehydrogenase (quinone)|nr:thiamine pyrophosphate-requiring protein [Kofleriaceae bacterium]